MAAHTFTLLHDGVNGNLRQQIGVLGADDASCTISSMNVIYAATSSRAETLSINGNTLDTDATSGDSTVVLLGI